MALLHHPDKKGKECEEEDRQLWLKIQHAYENLSDDGKRKKYDSSLPFDDGFPKDSELNDGNFFELFSAVFDRNARFANKKPIPDLGDINTPLKECKQFYSYWQNFDTWREFSQFHEHDTETAHDRYERRWMEKENKRVSDKHMKKERARLIAMVEMARSKDPRIQAELKKIEEEKQASKLMAREKKEAAQKKAKQAMEEVDRKKQEEADKKKQEDEQRKKALADERRNFKLKTKEFIAVLETKAPGSKFDQFYAEEFVKHFKTSADLISLIERV